MRIPEEKIEEIRSAADVVDIVGKYVRLKKAGANYKGLCPFHTEKTPSFMVSQQKQIFHCFGCHKGGDAFSFLMEYKKISYVEAVTELADEYGITIAYEQDNRGEQSENEFLYDLNEAAAAYFTETLLQHAEGKNALSYFEKRNIKPATMRTFGLGYSVVSRDALPAYFERQKLDLQRALTLGLIGKNESGRYYDRFAGRIIFPIHSPNGRIVGFGGRIMENRENTAKYLNSPESPIYIKGRTLYGLSHGKEEIRRQDHAILVEGYMDLISLHQHGIKNVVAVSGTALTDEQVNLLGRYTKNVSLIFDADSAGVKAALRSIEILLRGGFNQKIIRLPDNEDPDSYVQKNGKDAFLEEVGRGVDFIDFQTETFQQQGKLDNPTTAAEALREIVRLIALVPDALWRAIKLRALAARYQLRQNLLEKELEKVLSQKGAQKRNSTPAAEPVPQETPGRKRLKTTPLLQVEKEIIKLLFSKDRDVLSTIFESLSSDDFKSEAHRLLYNRVYDSYFHNEDLSPAALLEELQDEELAAYVRKLLIDKYSIGERWEEIRPAKGERELLKKSAFDTLQKFRAMQLEEEIAHLGTQIEEETDEAKQLGLLKQIRELKRQKGILTGTIDNKKKPLG